MACLLLDIDRGQCKLPTGYLVDGVDVEPQLDFWHQLGWEIVENIHDEETEAGKVYEGRMRERRETLGDHELVKYSKYCVKWLVDENKWQRFK